MSTASLSCRLIPGLSVKLNGHPILIVDSDVLVANNTIIVYELVLSGGVSFFMRKSTITETRYEYQFKLGKDTITVKK